jgi:putative ABC transport system permease protein
MNSMPTHKSPTARWCVQSLRRYRFRHLVYALTAALCAAILSAALSTGESLQAGLRRDLAARLGGVRSGVIRSRGLFPVSLAQRIPESEAALMLRGEMLDSSGIVCADRVNIFGIVGGAAAGASAPGAVAVNRRAAEIAGTFGGSGWSFRFEKPSPFSVELPLGTAGGDAAGRAPVSGVRPVAERIIPADFDPSPGSVPPVNIRLPYERLASLAGATDSANLLLSALEPERLESELRQHLTAADIGVTMTPAPPKSAGGAAADPGGQNAVTIRSREVFLPDAFSRALRESGRECEWAVFHLADDFAAAQGTNSTPYGFTAAVTPDGVIVPFGMQDDQIVVNRWLADTLGLRTGDSLVLRWRRFEAGGQLVPVERLFEICGIMSMQEAAQLKERMPSLPGLEGVDSCADWDIGMPMDEEKLEDRANEAYWKAYRETPKAVITYAAGKECFGTAFGEAMSVRVTAEEREIDGVIRTIDPAEIGFQVRALWREGVAAARGSTDFRGLFLGMSFLLVVSALTLAALTLSLALDSRSVEPALFSALGVRRGRTFGILLFEWMPATVAGGVLGGCCGTVLARTLVWSLSRFWSDAFAGARTEFYFSLPALLGAVLLTLALLFSVLAVKVYRYCGVAPVELMRGSAAADASGRRGGVIRLGVRIAGPLCALAALLIMIFFSGSSQANGAFFGAGFLLVVSALLFSGQLAAIWSERFGGGRAVVVSPFAAGVVGACRSGGRGRTLSVLLAAGFFLTVGMLAMKHDPAADSERSSSGSGGFQCMVFSTFGRNLEGGLELARRVTGSENIVPVRVREGDEAGCMNMSVPQVPRLYGLPIEAMAAMRAFEPDDGGGVWSVLRDRPGEGVIPALASDQAMLQYSLKMKAGVADGDEIAYRGADGRLWRIRIVGVLPVRISILQGALLLNEEHFVAMFPGEGFRMWLCDYAPYRLRTESSAEARYPEPGVRLETAVERLRTLGRMESTYLDMFLVLGGLGLLLGVFGVALVIARSIEERRYEFAVIQAVGIRRKYMVLSLVAEYGSLTAAGVLAGLVPALIAVQPAAASLNSDVNGMLVAVVVLLLVAAAVLSVAAGAFYALRGFDLSLLKRE